MVAMKTPMPVNSTPWRVKLPSIHWVQTKKVTTSMAAADAQVPVCSAVDGLPPSLVRTRKVPARETKMPMPASSRGSSTSAGSPSAWVAVAVAAAPSTSEPTMEPT